MFRVQKDFIPSFLPAGFLCVGFVQAQRKTLQSVRNAGEERAGSCGRLKRAQQSSHHGIEEAASLSPPLFSFYSITATQTLPDEHGKGEGILTEDEEHLHRNTEAGTLSECPHQTFWMLTGDSSVLFKTFLTRPNITPVDEGCQGIVKVREAARSDLFQTHADKSRRSKQIPRFQEGCCFSLVIFQRVFAARC